MNDIQFLALQNDLLNTFGPILFWWLIGILTGGIFLAIYLNVLLATRGMLDRWKV